MPHVPTIGRVGLRETSPQIWSDRDESSKLENPISVLREFGDSLEREAALRYELEVSGKLFPNYLRLWRRHVAPATYRPYSNQWREYADELLVSVHPRATVVGYRPLPSRRPALLRQRQTVS